MAVRMLSRGPRRADARVRVIDTGIGMSAETDRGGCSSDSARPIPPPTRRYGGSGLGLAISKRLAQMLGGDIVVQSALGQGACFRVTVATGPLEGVPMLDSPPSPCDRKRRPIGSRSASVPACGSFWPMTAPTIAASSATSSARPGSHVTIAENGQVACEKALAPMAEGKPFDLVLMDMQMPVMEGYEATRRLRDAGYKGPIIALTAHAAPEDRQKCLEAGCDHYVTKPIHRDHLLANVVQWIDAASPPTTSLVSTI